MNWVDGIVVGTDWCCALTPTTRSRRFSPAARRRDGATTNRDAVCRPRTRDWFEVHARHRYRLRRRAALAAFSDVGLPASAGPDGFVVWVQVPDETSALVNLARQGIVPAAGAKSFINPLESQLRFSVLQLPENRAGDLARAVRAAVDSADFEYFD